MEHLPRYSDWVRRARARSRGIAVPEDAFRELVSEALDTLPEEFAPYLENLEVVVADTPTREQMREAEVRRPGDLLGLYEGVPLIERVDAGMLFPDRVTLFRRPILALCRTRDEARAEVRRTLLHEIGHHFGISDERLEELDAY